MKNVAISILLLLAAMNISAQSVTYAYDNAGNRTARVIPQNPAPQAPGAMTALSDPVAEKTVSIYPNPTQGILSVEIKGYTDEVQAEFRLTDMTGRTVFSRKAASGYQTFDLSRQAAGIYLLQIRINGEATVWKIVKK